MSTYYEILQVQPTASIAEIEAACERQYNRWRRLVTHHDPDTANKANQALQWLEKARITLADPAKRDAYDVRIGLRGPVGGLADPQARPTASPPRPRAEPAPPSSPPTIERIDAWTCPKCHKANALGTPYCNQCGQQIGRKCPKCGALTQATFLFCSSCGVNAEEFVQKQQAKVRHTIEKSLSQISALIQQIQNTRSRKQMATWEKRIISLGEQITRSLEQLPDDQTQLWHNRLMGLLDEAEATLSKKNRRLFF